MRIVLITNIIAPYRIPLFNYLSERGVSFKVLFAAEKEANRKWSIHKSEIKFKYDILFNWNIFSFRWDRGLILNPGLFFRLVRENPDVVIVGGYSQPFAWVSTLYAQIFRKKLVLWSGTTQRTARRKRGLKKFLVRQATSCISYGHQATEYLRFLGAQNVFTALNVGDLQYYFKRRGFVSSDTVRFIFVGQLIPRKGILELLSLLVSLKGKWSLSVVGKGRQEEELRSFCREKGLNQVEFLGFKNKRDLAKAFTSHDIFIMPSLSDPATIVLSEALTSGLFVLGSCYDGSSHNLINDGFNGYIFDPKNRRETRETLKRVMTEIEKIRKRRERIAEDAIEMFSVEKYGDVFLNCLNSL